MTGRRFIVGSAVARQLRETLGDEFAGSFLESPPLPPAPVTLQSITDMLGRAPKPKRAELHCHPMVTKILRGLFPMSWPDIPWGDPSGRLTGIDIIEKPEMAFCSWELREDGEVVKSGTLTVAGIVHSGPPDGSQATPCCGKTPFDLPRTDRITEDPALISCNGA